MSRLAWGDASACARGRPYVERSDLAPRWYDELALQVLRRTWLPWSARWAPSTQASILPAYQAHAATLAAASETDLKAACRRLRGQMARAGRNDALLPEAFAMIAEASARTTGQRPRPCQITAAWHMMQRRLVEMATGEGKTLAASLPAVAAAWCGMPVHVITVNDYLARRDAGQLRDLYAFLGLEVGLIQAGMSAADRQAAYACPVTYCSNKELAFDYLRDRLASRHLGGPLPRALRALHGCGKDAQTPLLLRGLVFAIVDEADSVFIDDAQTPLILASPAPPSHASPDCEQALAWAATLEHGRDFTLDRPRREVELTAAGSALMHKARMSGTIWSSQRAREEFLVQALRALHLFERDRDYIVADGKVLIVDEFTGRTLADRHWERGLHQLVEAKEGCEPSSAQTTAARLTYQRLFRRYLHLCGMTGTAVEVAGEVRQVYGLGVRRAPLHRPCRRDRWPDELHTTSAEKWAAVAASALRVSASGRPVLIGTRSVAESEAISARLHASRLSHALLNAKQDGDEAAIVAEAGQQGRITVATNMAGRGTDIRLGPGVAERGGLHVILTAFHEARRIDRQLFGRCARQGDPGSCQAIVSMDDPLFQAHAPRATRLASAVLQSLPVARPLVAQVLRRLAQSATERSRSLARRQVLRTDQRLENAMAFSGRTE